MKLLRTSKIRTRLLAGFLLILIVSSAAGLISNMSLVSINNKNKATYESAIMPLESLMAVEVAFANVRQTSRGFIIRIISDPSQLEKQEERLKGLLDTMSSAVDTYIQTLKDCNANPAIIQESESVKALYETEFKPYIQNMMEIAKSGDTPATVALLDSTNEVSTKIYDNIQEIYHATLAEMSASTNENSATADKSSLFTMALTLFSFVACLILAILVSNSIVIPIKHLLGITDDLAHGRLEVNTLEASRDEVGTLVTNFFIVIDTLKSIVDGMNGMYVKHTEGDFDVKMDTDAYEGVYKDMAIGVNDMVFSYIDNVKELINVMSNISEGQFDVSIRRYPGKKATINEAVDNIASSFKGISGEIRSLAAAAGNGELSRRSNVDNYKGDWAGILQELNALLEYVIAPIQEASEVLSEIAMGNLDVNIKSEYKGDFALIKTSVNGMVSTISSYINEISEVLTNLSNDNLDQEITRKYVGRFSELKIAINQITDKLNSVVSEISTTSDHVSSGAKNISESSMMLAQAATEQASSVQELAATVDVLNQQTQRNAENAATVNELSEESKRNTDTVNSEMKQMLLSMDGIKEASSNISKIIKVIEDIAFQTNLLALNAAVEAARAGEHGKGFSVVAEEVRNLASRSQTAAKETNDLIVNSITRVDDGMKIAAETAESLDVITKRFEQMSEIISEITIASKEQAVAISEISGGLEQISQAVQTNTANSEESASTSEQLAGQSEILKNMTSVFKLKNR